LVLGHAHAYPELTGNIGNLALLKLAGRMGLIPEAQGLAAHDAYREFRRRQHRLRLAGDKYARVARDAVSAQVQAVLDLWRAVFGAS
jgi:glutamate-ammonia-ligase adenylyltransferase